MTEMAKAKDGERLLALMAVAKVSQSKLAREMGITSTSIARYIEQLSNDTINEEVWFEMAHALRRLSVVADDIRPVRSPTIIRTDLIPLLDRFNAKEQLEALLQILDGHRDARDVLRVVAEDRLKRWP